VHDVSQWQNLRHFGESLGEQSPAGSNEFSEDDCVAYLQNVVVVVVSA